MGDSHRIQQVLTNVITNAIKYTVSGSITLSFRWIENCVCFACDDTGPGIPKSEQKNFSNVMFNEEAHQVLDLASPSRNTWLT
jgi:K+-sensing histidine kinase KdpD